MPRLTIRTPGYGVTAGGTPAYRPAPQTTVTALVAILQQATVPRAQVVQVNYTTGFAGTQHGSTITPQTVAARLRSGQHWVDYGNWPFGTVSGPGGGFGAFIHAAGLGTALPPPPAAQHEGLGTAASCIPALGGNFNGLDPYAYALCDWSWGGEAAARGYPDQFGFPTLRAGATATFRPMPGAPAVTGLGASGVAVYSAFAVRVGRAWYFEAQPTIAPTAYARFIADVLGATLPAAATGTRVTTPGAPQCGGAVLGYTGGGERGAGRHAVIGYPSLHQGDTGPWVALAQTRLNVWGAHLAVDGIFGPLTAAAVRTLQAAHAGQSVHGQPAITTSGVIGPGLWALLCTTPGATAPGRTRPAPKRPPPPSRRPTSPSGGSSLITKLAHDLGLSVPVTELLLAGGALTLLVVLG